MILNKTKLLFLLLMFLAFNKSNGNTDTIPLKTELGASMLIFNLGYRCPLNKTTVINSGHGIFVEGGLNAGYFLKNKQFIAVIGGLGFKDKLWNTSFSDKFIDELNISWGDNILSPADTHVVSGFKTALNSKPEKGFSGLSCRTNTFHNYSFYYGLMFNLPFVRYQTFIKLYRGATRSACSTSNSGCGVDYNYFEIRRKMYGLELTVFPGFSKKMKNCLFGSALSAHLGMLSVYYERISFSNSKLYYSSENAEGTIELNKFIAPAFLKNYKNENVIGLKLSWSVY